MRCGSNVLVEQATPRVCRTFYLFELDNNFPSGLFAATKAESSACSVPCTPSWTPPVSVNSVRLPQITRVGFSSAHPNELFNHPDKTHSSQRHTLIPFTRARIETQCSTRHRLDGAQGCGGILSPSLVFFHLKPF